MKLNRRVIAIVAALAMLLMGFGALTEGKITVQGTGSVQVDADWVTISLGVRESAADVVSAQSAVNEKISAVIDALKGMGVSTHSISTSGIGLYTNYDYDANGAEIVGSYSAYNTLLLSVRDVENAGAYIDAAFAAGANSLDYVDFSASTNDEAAQKALTLAVESAREKARVLAEAAGVKLGAVLEITENGDYGFSSGTMYAKSEAAAEEAAGTGVLASMQTVSATVNVTFALED